ncbi:TlpA family protein disulfide reductase [Flavobacteriaceae bacterium AU392]|nr:TlpA family protein disulfide reductase [Flavobacteriaceae bacterium]RKM84151.1 TlpA family protein disulfide reductase [Flavobacteriaceae bacterium AU392]
MVDLINKLKNMKEYHSFNSKVFCLLFLYLLLACEKSNQQATHFAQTLNNTVSISNNVNDSISISVKLKSDEEFGFNILDKYFKSHFVYFPNKKKRDTTITKKIPRTFNNQIFTYGGFYKGDPKLYKNYYVVDKQINRLDFEKNKGDVNLIYPDSEQIIATTLFLDYEQLNTEIHQSKGNNKKLNEENLIKIYDSYKEKYMSENKLLLNELNQTYFIYTLQKIYPFDERIDTYIKNIKKPQVINKYINKLFVDYIKNRIHQPDFNQFLYSNKFSDEFKRLLSIGMFNFLRLKENKTSVKYKSAKEWLRTTNLYKNDSVYIKKEITPLNNTLFKERLNKLKLVDSLEKEISFSKLLKQHPSSYYLIDFWATWCAPCIQGIHTMKTLDMPKNVKVISLSLDKIKDKEKWKAKTKELEQPITYWLDDTNEDVISFLKFIEILSIPRYLVIDKNMNLIDPAFYAPHQSQFLSKLQSVKNHKYW